MTVFFSGEKMILQSTIKTMLKASAYAITKGTAPLGFYYVYEIYFTNGHFIQFPGLLISEPALIWKLPGKKTEKVHAFLATCLRSKLTG